ncbi:MAG: TonB-dependent receptor [Bacteroidales bacterium]
MKKSILFFTLSLVSMNGFAENLRGVIKDRQTNEELIGATVIIKELEGKAAVTGLDGSFLFKDIPEGKKLTLQCRYVGYNSVEWVVVAGQTHHEVFLNQNSVELKDVVVSGTMSKNTDNGARFLEKKAFNVMNVVSARSIEVSPDLNVANVLQRVSGVTMERSNSGDGQYAILRGMDKRYNYTLVNGVKIPSPDNKNRYVPLNIFPSELLDRLEVTKSLTADMEGDATGGAINMVMKDAPAKRTFQINLSSGYNALFFDRDYMKFGSNDITKTAPRYQYGTDYKATVDDFAKGTSKIATSRALPNVVGGFMYGDRLLNEKLGVVVAGSFQNLYKGNNSLFYTDVMNQTESAVRLSTMKKREYSENQMQYGLHAKLDYQLNENHKLEWYNAFIGNKNEQLRNTTATNLSLNYAPDKGNVLDNLEIRSRLTSQQIFASTLQGEHHLSKVWKADWSAVYSHAGNDRPDNTAINLENNRTNFVDHITADNTERRWEKNTDRDMAAYLNINYKKSLSLGKLDAKAGGMYRDKARTNQYVSYLFTPAAATRPVYGKDFETLDQIDWKISAPKGSVGPLNYEAAEKIGAAYAMGSFETKQWHLIAGIRAEHTLQSYLMEFPAAGDDPYGEQNYWDFLPSVHLKYMPLEKMNIRASYFRSINRPGFFEIVPYSIINEDYMEFGNKNLKRSQIDNIDFRLEYFPSANEQFMAGFFYKRIKNPIEYAYSSVNNRQFGYGPSNLGNAANYGFEVDMIKYVRNFGLKANYTYTHSAITTEKTLYGRDESGKLERKLVDQTRPLVNQAPHVANISLLYKDTKYNWDAQVAVTYSGEKIVIASHYLDSDYWEEGSFSLDVSIEKKFKSGISAFVKGNNLLNTPVRRFIKTVNPYNANFENQNIASGKTLIREDFHGQTLLAGARYRF